MSKSAPADDDYGHFIYLCRKFQRAYSIGQVISTSVHSPFMP